MRLSAASLFVLLVTVLGAALTARLGWWQLDRAAQKNALQQALEQRRAEPPLPLAALASDEAAALLQHHRRVELRGRWLDEATVYLENRQMEGRPGFFVLTPLLLEDGSAVVVQRGWQPRDLLDRTRVVPPPAASGPVLLAGRIAPPPARLYEFDPEATGPIRQNLVLDAYAREWRLRLRPLSVLQEEDATAVDGGIAPAADGLLRNWPAPAGGVHKHHGYAFQWFALCALIISLYVWFQFLRPWLSARRKS